MQVQGLLGRRRGGQLLLEYAQPDYKGPSVLTAADAPMVRRMGALARWLSARHGAAVRGRRCARVSRGTHQWVYLASRCSKVPKQSVCAPAPSLCSLPPRAYPDCWLHSLAGLKDGLRVHPAWVAHPSQALEADFAINGAHLLQLTCMLSCCFAACASLC